MSKIVKETVSGASFAATSAGVGIAGSTMAAAGGTIGGSIVTSSLATIGAVVGGGMVAGVAVVAVAAAATGFGVYKGVGALGKKLNWWD